MFPVNSAPHRMTVSLFHTSLSVLQEAGFRFLPEIFLGRAARKSFRVFSTFSVTVAHVLPVFPLLFPACCSRSCPGPPPTRRLGAFCQDVVTAACFWHLSLCKFRRVAAPSLGAYYRVSLWFCRTRLAGQALFLA